MGAKRSTAITLTTFLVVCGALSVSPAPLWLKPFEVSSAEDAKKLAARVFHKPRMTLAESEDKLAGGSADGRDAPEGQGIDENALAEEKELYSTRDAQADVEALKQATPQPREEAAAKPVDRQALVHKVASPKADRFREQARSVKAPGAQMENPCVEKA